jgi:aminoglycoside phosphotransferase
MPVRASPDELNIEEPEQLRAYLVQTGRLAPGAAVSLERLPGGVSARTVLVRHGSGPGWVLKQALPKLRVQADWFSDPERIHREAEGLRWLGKSLPVGATPRFLFEDRDHHLLAMEAVPQPHRNWKTMLLNGEVHDVHVRQFAILLAQLQRAAGQESEAVAQAFGDRTFFESLRLEPYYAYTASQVPASAEFLRALMTETRACRLTLVHGDYSPKNVLVRGERLVLLDHEVIHLGDPAFDLGFSLTHLLSKAHHLPAHREAFERAALLYWHSYRTAIADAPWREGLEERVVRHTLGCLLARVAGRSPLEYLSPAERTRQREIAVTLMTLPCTAVSELVEAVLDRI